MSGKFSFAIDRGGTFTDVVASGPDGDVTKKVLSVCPEYPDAPSEGIRQVLEDHLGKAVPRPIATDLIKEIRMGTTVATNALLERKGARVVLLVTKGFADVLSIGSQARPDLFDLNIRRPTPLAERVVEVDERMRLSSDGPRLTASPAVAVDLDAARLALQQAFDDGIRSVAVSLVHSFVAGEHEAALAAIAKEIGFPSISVSSELMPMIKYLERTATTTVNAYLSPVVKEYIAQFRAQFADGCKSVPLLFMQSDGGLVPADNFDAFRAVLSGPAGGVTGCGRVGVAAFGKDVPLVGFDMGGTSTDVCRCVDGEVEMTMVAEVAGALLQFPQVEVHTVAAGGGSVLEWRDGLFTVGPHSAGAFPGPMCYGRGGPLTVTDANVMLGRLHPHMLPSLFGKDGASPIDPVPVRAAFEALAERVSRDTGSAQTAVGVAQSFIIVANEQMARPVRTLTEGRGYSCNTHGMVSFGGAGGQHACDIARLLGVGRVLVPRHASVLSAVGIGTAPIVAEKLLPWGGRLDGDSVSLIADAIVSAFKDEGAAPAGATTRSFLALRFRGTAATLSVEAGSSGATIDVAEVTERFTLQHKTEFGFVLDRDILVDSIRVRRAHGDQPLPSHNQKSGVSAAGDAVAVQFARGEVMARVVDTLAGPATVDGPALLRCVGSTVVLDPDATAEIDDSGNIVITLHEVKEDATAEKSDATKDPRVLTVFSHRFMSIAEQMGRALQRTAVSTNIKERLDFSCAIFDADAGLIANAPHIPVHLGAMGATVAFQKAKFGADWKDDDVIVCNHPAHGGSHLPDITVIAPIVTEEAGRIGYVACRAHHSDIGGATPGSMPPFSTSLLQEGAIIEGLKLVDGGSFNEEGITKLLMEPANVAGCEGCRTLPDVLSDLRAQVAANQKGVNLMRDLVKQQGVATVTAYMRHLQDTAADAVRDLIRGCIDEHAGADASQAVLRCTDQMDDGTAVALAVTLDRKEGAAHFDFAGTGRQVQGSTNCPRQVVRSAVLYSLRCLLNRTASSFLPLNEGCMRPLRIDLPDNSLLSPGPEAAIVAGNVLTSQRITDVILSAFKACACSQGDMNNLTFGNERYSYYETVCGGSGAGPTFNGASAVHTHMTNTRITDVEWLESRFPVLLREFKVRHGSGGQGAHVGGCGVVRSFLFLEDMQLCMLSERRAVAPRGTAGGCDGERGLNLLLRNAADASADVATVIRQGLEQDSLDSRAVSVGGKADLTVRAGDIFTMLTPGGGGFGAAP